ncbi:MULTISPECIES: amidase domain-containing protein [Kitasatospora]|uniref:amidase domain-containing protein n=1 Tax=Kitasatospora TaxID=2063 RepID=UPI000C7045DC|nr:amidase domain-containing protein [Kitasatospora sp. GP30]MDH6145880.1 hypothetical protein [Kitasatospora sp. GP30]
MRFLADLQQADPSAWKKAADGWLAAVNQATAAVDDLHAQGIGPLAKNWTDAVGQTAAAKITEQASALDSAADIMRGVVMVLDGFSHSLEYAQTTLNNALALATSYNLQVDLVQGCVQVADDGSTPGNQDQINQVNQMLSEAFREADQADHRVAAELDQLAGDTGVVTKDQSQELDVIQAGASQVELASYAGDIPDGKNPQLVAAWWAGLSPTEQQQFMNAAPLTIVNLPGIPDDVKNQMRGTDGKYDRMAFVQYATDHWNDGHGDVSGENNCTNFTSNALHEAGMQYKGWNTYDDNGWGQSTLGEWGWDFGWSSIAGQEHTNSWSSAQDLHDFLLNNGGAQVPRDQVKPGDIMFLQQDNNQDSDLTQGNVHHTAIVTAVTPDGDIRYTQHTDSRLNVSLDGRSHYEQEQEGQQNYQFVRPQPNWY